MVSLDFFFNLEFWCLTPLSAISWRPVLVVGEAGVPREAPTLGKQLVNFITCGCELSTPFFIIYKAAQTHAVLVIGLSC
jgi:hypothetical protein